MSTAFEGLDKGASWRRGPDRATDQIRAGHQSQHRQDAKTSRAAPSWVSLQLARSSSISSRVWVPAMARWCIAGLIALGSAQPRKRPHNPPRPSRARRRPFFRAWGGQQEFFGL